MWGVLTLMRLPVPAVPCAEGAGEGPCPGTWLFGFSAPPQGPGLLSLLNPLGRCWGAGGCPPPPWEATEECLHATQNVTALAHLSQSLHGLCPPCACPLP